MATKTALALLAPGSEEMELVITVDVLRRAGVSYRLSYSSARKPFHIKKYSILGKRNCCWSFKQ